MEDNKPQADAKDADPWYAVDQLYPAPETELGHRIECPEVREVENVDCRPERPSRPSSWPCGRYTCATSTVFLKAGVKGQRILVWSSADVETKVHALPCPLPAKVLFSTISRLARSVQDIPSCLRLDVGKFI